MDDPFGGPLFGDARPARGHTGGRSGHASPDRRPVPGPDASRAVPPSQAGGSEDRPDDERWSEGPADDRWSHGRWSDQGWSDQGGSDQGGSDQGGDDEVFPKAAATPSKQRGSTASFFRELPVLLLIAFVLAFLLRTFVLQVFYIPSSSMEPTLQINDRMAVEKLTYLFREPRRGEIVVFEGEELGQTDPDADLGERVIRGVGQFLGVVPASAKDYVKRVIGLPGDEILIEDGLVFVNGQPIDEPYVVYPDGASYGPVTVPDDSLFFLGDNRPNSSDSRRGLGFVPLDDVVGRSFVTIWPPDNMGSLTGVEYELPDDP